MMAPAHMTQVCLLNARQVYAICGRLLICSIKLPSGLPVSDLCFFFHPKITSNI